MEVDTPSEVNHAYRVVRWLDLYEVDETGRPYAGGRTPLRAGPLAYVRWRVAGHAHNLGPGYRMLQQACATAPDAQADPSPLNSPAYRLLAAYAVFGKALELAANQDRHLRGWVLDHDGAPCDAAAVAFYSGFPLSAVQRGLADLCHPRVRWLELAPFPRPYPAAPGETDHVAELVDAAPVRAAVSRRQQEPVGASRNLQRLAGPFKNTTKTATQPTHPPAFTAPSPGAAAGRGGQGVGVGSEGVALRRMLLAAGVGVNHHAAALAHGSLTPARLVAWWADVQADESVKRKGPYLASVLVGGAAGANHRLTWGVLSKALKAGVVQSVNGVAAADLAVRGSGNDVAWVRKSSGTADLADAPVVCRLADVDKAVLS